jgi:hypothetical protein
MLSQKSYYNITFTVLHSGLINTYASGSLYSVLGGFFIRSANKKSPSAYSGKRANLNMQTGLKYFKTLLLYFARFRGII